MTKINDDCVMEIYTGRVGKLSDIPKFTRNWYRTQQSKKLKSTLPTYSRMGGLVNLQVIGWDAKKRNLRQQVWVLKRQIIMTWRHMVSLLTSGGKPTKGLQTANTLATQKIQEGKYSTLKVPTVPLPTNISTH